MSGGPAITAAAIIPDMDHYHGRGGRAWPLWLDAAGTAPNVVPELLAHLEGAYGVAVSGPDLFAYVVGVLTAPAYTARYAVALREPGLRVPLTASGELFAEMAELGRRVLWLHTYGERFADAEAERPQEPPRMPADNRPKVTQAIPDTGIDAWSDLIRRCLGDARGRRGEDHARSRNRLGVRDLRLQDSPPVVLPAKARP